MELDWLPVSCWLNLKVRDGRVFCFCSYLQRAIGLGGKTESSSNSNSSSSLADLSGDSL